MKTNILLIDSYKNMESLVAYAFSFSHRTNRLLKIIYVFDFEQMAHGFDRDSAHKENPVAVKFYTSAKKEFEDAELKIRYIIREYLKNYSVDVPVEILVSDNYRIDLLNEVTRNMPDSILMVSNLQDYSEAGNGIIDFPNIVYHMKCPVLVIPDNTRYAVLKHVLYAANFHPDDVIVLKQLTDLLYSPDLKIAVLFNPEGTGYEERLRWEEFLELIKEQTVIQHLIPVIRNEKNPLEAIESYIEENDPDMLVLLSDKKGFFGNIFNAGVTNGTLTCINTPVLVYHEN